MPLLANFLSARERKKPDFQERDKEREREKERERRERERNYASFASTDPVFFHSFFRLPSAKVDNAYAFHRELSFSMTQSQ